MLIVGHLGRDVARRGNGYGKEQIRRADRPFHGRGESWRNRASRAVCSRLRTPGSLIAFLIIGLYYGFGELTQSLAAMFAGEGTLAQRLVLIAVPLALLAVATVLALGLWNMVWGRSAVTSQSLMRWRVALQFIALCLVMAALYRRSDQDGHLPSATRQKNSQFFCRRPSDRSIQGISPLRAALIERSALLASFLALSFSATRGDHLK